MIAGCCRAAAVNSSGALARVARMPASSSAYACRWLALICTLGPVVMLGVATLVQTPCERLPAAVAVGTATSTSSAITPRIRAGLELRRGSPTARCRRFIFQSPHKDAIG